MEAGKKQTKIWYMLIIWFDLVWDIRGQMDKPGDKHHNKVKEQKSKDTRNDSRESIYYNNNSLFLNAMRQ